MSNRNGRPVFATTNPATLEDGRSYPGDSAPATTVPPISSTGARYEETIAGRPINSRAVATMRQ